MVLNKISLINSKRKLKLSKTNLLLIDKQEKINEQIFLKKILLVQNHLEFYKVLKLRIYLAQKLKVQSHQEFCKIKK